MDDFLRNIDPATLLSPIGIILVLLVILGIATERRRRISLNIHLPRYTVGLTIALNSGHGDHAEENDVGADAESA